MTPLLSNNYARLKQILENGLKLNGGTDALGFLFFYELLTDTLRIRLLSDDRPHTLASILVSHVAQDTFVLYCPFLWALVVRPSRKYVAYSVVLF